MGLLLVATLLAVSPSGSWATAVPSLVKVRPGQSLPSRTAVSLHAARGECESFQIATTAPAKKVRPTALQLTGAGRKLPVALYREGYETLRLPSGPDGAPGDWPDALIPVSDPYVHEPRNAFPFDATAEKPVVVFAEACVPASAAPGEYRGELLLQSEDRAPQRFAVTLRVDPFELPATSSLPNSFGLSLYSVAKGHHADPAAKDTLTLLNRYAQELLAHRITAYGMTFDPPRVTHDGGALHVDFNGYDQEMAPFIEGKVLPDGARFTSAGVIMDRKLTADADRVAYLRAWSDHFAQKRWPVVLFYYAKDEPTPEDIPTVLDEGLHVRRAGGLSTLVTSAYEPQLAKATDIFCPLINCFFPGPAAGATCRNPVAAQALRNRVAPWGHVWWYQSCMSHGCDGPISNPKLRSAFEGWASYMIDASGPTNRAMGPLAYLNHIGGELYFDTVYAYHQQDPWQSVWAFGGNGDGTLFYPGTPEKIGGKTPIPVASLRLANIRDGLEDYEYLALADKLGLHELAQSSARALTPAANQITQDPATWERVRDQLASALSAAWTKKYSNPAVVHH